VDIAKPDLERFPLLASARVWCETVQPGEILLLPHGTFHQCKNVTDCLSCVRALVQPPPLPPSPPPPLPPELRYSRFHLDAANMPALVKSWKDQDAEEGLDHEEVSPPPARARLAAAARRRPPSYFERSGREQRASAKKG
jgi:hypothetical protein